MLLKFINKFVNKHRYVEVIVWIFIYSALFVYFWKFTFNNFLGLLISLTGFILWIKSLKDLGSSFQISPKAKKLVTTGMYSKFRNPIYYSGFLIDIGAVIYTLNWIVFSIAFIIFIIQLFRIHKEEKILTQKFRKKYIGYKKQTWF